MLCQYKVSSFIGYYKSQYILYHRKSVVWGVFVSSKKRIFALQSI